MDSACEYVSVGGWCFIRVTTWSDWRTALEALLSEAGEVLDERMIVELNHACRLSAGYYPLPN